MGNKFVESMKEKNNKTYTEKGAKALKSTKSDLLDLFGTIGSLRSRSEEEIERLFSKAFAEDKELATRTVFYARNIRGGLGERRVARVIWRYLAHREPEIIRDNLHHIVEYGRADDLLCLLGTPCEEDVLKYIKIQLEKDCKNVGYRVPWETERRWLTIKDNL